MKEKIEQKIGFLTRRKVAILDDIKGRKNISSDLIIYEGNRLKEIDDKIAAYEALFYA